MNRKQDTAGSRRRTPGPKRTKATGMRHSSDITDRSDRTESRLTGLELLALAEATGRLAPSPLPEWVDDPAHQHGPTPLPLDVAVALSRVLAAFNPDPVAVIDEARQIYLAMLDGLHLQARSEMLATSKQTFIELKAVADASARLASILRRIRQPAIESINSIICSDYFSDRFSTEHVRLEIDITRLNNAARQSCNEIVRQEKSDSPTRLRDFDRHIVYRTNRGRPNKFIASNVCARTSIAFFNITKVTPTITTDPISNTSHGAWLEALRAVFEALHIEASPEAQARALQRNSKALR